MTINSPQLGAGPGEIPAENLQDRVGYFIDGVRVDEDSGNLDLDFEVEQRLFELSGPRFQGLFRADELFLGSLARQANAVCVLQGHRAK